MIATGFLRAAASVGLGMMALAGNALADAEQKRQDELDMLERARREAPAQSASARPRLDVIVSPARAPANIVPSAPADRKGLEDQRKAELDRLSDKLRRAAAVRPARTTEQATAPAPWTTEVIAAPAERAPPPFEQTQRFGLGRPDLLPTNPAAHAGGRVTILMVMQPGDRGIRRTQKTADPILCAGGGCWVSAGDNVAARFLEGRRSLGVMNTLGPRAGACREQTACVFRDVDLGAAPSTVLPIDLRLVKHDRREAATVTADTSCRVTRDRLVCGAPVRGPDYVMWVVPETIADLAGPELLRRAVEAGLATN